MSKNNTYSLWLVPAERLYDRLYSLIQQLSRPYNTPEFEPHVTLLGGLTGDLETIILKSATLASTMKYFNATLAALDHREEFYRCLFAHLEHTEAIMQANARARQVFGDVGKESYMPHLSLMYGSVNTRIKQKIIQTISTEIHGTFTVEQFHLYSTTGLPDRWFRIAQFALKY
jgi:2'-5' RNA ligase